MIESGRSIPPSRLVLLWVAVVVGLGALGTAGYVVLEGWSPGDALYMTIITLTTVGFREVGTLDGVGRALTALLSIAAVITIFGTVGIVTEIVASAAFRRRTEERMRHTVDALTDHFIICGFGRVGTTVARELRAGGAKIVVVEEDLTIVETARAMGLAVVVGDATDDAVLKAAGIERAKGLVGALNSDANNLYVVLSARELNPALFVVTRATTAAAEAKLRRAGANRVVSPYEMAGHQLAALVRRPRVVEFVDAAMRASDTALYALEELAVVAGSRLAGRPLSELIERGAAVLAVVDTAGELEVKPSADHLLVAGESVIVAGPSALLTALREGA